MTVCYSNKLVRPSNILKALPILLRKRRGWAAVNCYLRAFKKLEATKGIDQTIKFFKELALNSKRFAMGLEVSHTYPFWTSLDNQGFPKRFKFLKDFLVSESSVMIGYGLTVTNLYRIIRTEPVVSLANITAEFSGWERDGGEDFKHFCKDFVIHTTGAVEIPDPIEVLDSVDDDGFEDEWEDEDDFVMVSKPSRFPILCTMGPQRIPNILGSPLDAIALLNPINKNYFDAVETLFKKYFVYDDDNFLFNQRIRDWLTTNLRPSRVLARLGFIPDKGGKTRIVTTVNYWIQSALYPVHQELADFLKKLERDLTFNEEALESVIRSMFRKGKCALCFDLTAATDMWPVESQYTIVKLLLGKEVADAWLTLMRLPITHENADYVFSIGQPMGIYSSFPAFAIAHHAVIKYCATLAGVCDDPSFSDYVIRGDDVVIFDSDVAELYRDYMTTVLGLEINTYKCVLSEDHFVAEFCKRLFVERGGKLKEITPLSPGMLIASRRNGLAEMQDLVKHVYLRWRFNKPINEQSSSLFQSLIPPSILDDAITVLSCPFLGGYGFPMEGKLVRQYWGAEQFNSKDREFFRDSLLLNLSTEVGRFMDLSLKKLKSYDLYKPILGFGFLGLTRNKEYYERLMSILPEDFTTCHAYTKVYHQLLHSKNMAMMDVARIRGDGGSLPMHSISEMIEVLREAVITLLCIKGSRDLVRDSVDTSARRSYAISETILRLAGYSRSVQRWNL